MSLPNVINEIDGEETNNNNKNNNNNNNDNIEKKEKKTAFILYLFSRIQGFY
jgi:hypothetical protein